MDKNNDIFNSNIINEDCNISSCIVESNDECKKISKMGNPIIDQILFFAKMFEKYLAENNLLNYISENHKIGLNHLQGKNNIMILIFI